MKIIYGLSINHSQANLKILKVPLLFYYHDLSHVGVQLNMFSRSSCRQFIDSDEFLIIGLFFQEKTDGRQSAIAETIAMMKKMQMEDKERKEAAKEKEEKRKAMNPDSGDAADNQG